MGFFDLICPPRVSTSNPGEPPFAPTEPPTVGTCQNCHESRTSESDCPAFEDWPRGLYRPIDSIAHDPQSFRWWMDENRLRTALRRRTRQEIFPFEVGPHSLRIEIDPNETNVGSWFVTSSTRVTMNLQGEGPRLFLTADPLISVSNIRLIDSLRIFMERGSHSLTSDSILLNWFVPPHHLVLGSIPVAYDPETGRTYNYTAYTRRVLIENQCGAPTRIAGGPSTMDGGIPPPLDPRDAGTAGMDGSPFLDLPPDIIEEMRRSAPNLGTGYADAGCGYFPLLPQRLPYLFELAHRWAQHRAEAETVDLLRLYRDIRTLERHSPPAESSSSGPSPLSFLDQVRLVWNLSPQRLAFENFLVEFDSPTQRTPMTVTVAFSPRGLRSIELNHRITLSQLYVPGWIHLGETSFHFEGTGPRLNIQVNEIDSEILPFDLGQDDPSTRGVLHVARGRIRDGEEFSEGDIRIPPGLFVEGDLNDVLRYQVNLRLDLVIQSPEGVRYDVSGQLLGQGRLLSTDQGLEPELGTTWLSLRDITLREHQEGGESYRPEALLEGASLTMTDQEESEETRTGFHIRFEFPQGSLPFFQAGHFETFFPLRAFDVADQTYLNNRPLADWTALAVYRPDLQFSDFVTDLNFGLTGRAGVPDAVGDFHFETHTPEMNTRTFEALFQVSPLGIPLGRGLLAYFNPLRMHLQATQERDEEGLCHFEVPILQILANTERPRRGLFRGEDRIVQSSQPSHILTAHFDPSAHRLEVENVELRFLFRRIMIPALSEATRGEPHSPPSVTGLDLDGRFRGHWSMDTETGRGRGRLCLVGDSSDIALRGADGRGLPDPLVSDTRWCATSVRRVDSAHHILWGNFFLDTTFDWGLLRYFGIHVNMRERGRMAHDNFPYWIDGYPYIERLFFRRVGEEHRRQDRERRVEP